METILEVRFAAQVILRCGKLTLKTIAPSKLTISYQGNILVLPQKTKRGNAKKSSNCAARHVDQKDLELDVQADTSVPVLIAAQFTKVRVETIQAPRDR